MSNYLIMVYGFSHWTWIYDFKNKNGINLIGVIKTLMKNLLKLLKLIILYFLMQLKWKKHIQKI